jgi:hypothetical protein
MEKNPLWLALINSGPTVNNSFYTHPLFSLSQWVCVKEREREREGERERVREVEWEWEKERECVRDFRKSLSWNVIFLVSACCRSMRVVRVHVTRDQPVPEPFQPVNPKKFREKCDSRICSFFKLRKLIQYQFKLELGRAWFFSRPGGARINKTSPAKIRLGL